MSIKVLRANPIEEEEKEQKGMKFSKYGINEFNAQEL